MLVASVFFLLDGFGELHYASGDVYKGTWKDGQRHGKVSLFLSLSLSLSLVHSHVNHTSALHLLLYVPYIYYRHISTTQMVMSSKGSLSTAILRAVVNSYV